MIYSDKCKKNVLEFISRDDENMCAYYTHNMYVCTQLNS